MTSHLLAVGRVCPIVGIVCLNSGMYVRCCRGETCAAGGDYGCTIVSCFWNCGLCKSLVISMAWHVLYVRCSHGGQEARQRVWAM